MSAEEFARGRAHLASLPSLVSDADLRRLPLLEKLSLLELLALPGMPRPIAATAAGGRGDWKRRDITRWWEQVFALADAEQRCLSA